MAAHVSIVENALPPMEPDPSRTDAGAELVFHGRVRDTEHGKPIVALYYEHYAGMTERELQSLANEIVDGHRDLDLTCVHRVGTVKIGEASLRVVVRSPHRAEASTALEAFIVALKQRVPIWKWGVRPDGTRFPA